MPKVFEWKPLNVAIAAAELMPTFVLRDLQSSGLGPNRDVLWLEYAQASRSSLRFQ